MNPKSKGLGRGLGAIFEMENASIGTSAKNSTAFEEIEIARIHPNPKQPRSTFDPEALGELADSIRTLGVIQPITVKREEEGYTIISGERRWRASQQAGLETIPAYIREVDDRTLLEMAIVENIQRQDLNAIEVALSLQRLVDECSLTQDSLAERVGKKRSTVANYMRLLKLPIEVQLAIREGILSMGHARALAGLADPALQLTLLKRVLKRGLSVRQTEELVRKTLESRPAKVEEEEFPESYSRLVETLEPLFSQNISIRKNNKGGGKIVIGFDSDHDIEAFIERFNGIKG